MARDEGQGTEHRAHKANVTHKTPKKVKKNKKNKNKSKKNRNTGKLAQPHRQCTAKQTNRFPNTRWTSHEDGQGLL